MPIAVGNTTDGSSRAGKTFEHGITALLEPEYVESQIKTIIADVLQMDLDGLDETQSFLKLGGDSILAIKVMARCRAKGITLSVADMIDARNIADLCRRVSQSAPGALLNGNDAYRAAPKENSLSALQDESATAKPSEFMESDDCQDITNTSIPYKPAHQQATRVAGNAFIENALASILLELLPPHGTQLEPLDFIHSALVTAVSLTTSSNIESILFYNVCGDVSGGDGIAGGSSHTTSLFRTRLFPFEDDRRLLRRVQGCTRADYYFDDEVDSQQDPNVLTPDSNSDDNIIVVDVRQLRQHRGGEECPVGPVSEDFLSGVQLNLDDSLHLSISLRSTNNGITCSLSGNDLWHAHYDLGDFINVFSSSLKGMLRRLQNNSTNPALKDSLALQPTQLNEKYTTSEDVQGAQSISAGLNARSAEARNRILHPETRTIRSVLPCSPIQEGFLISQSTNPNLYQCCFVLKFTKSSHGLPVDAGQVGASWREVVKRHAILRTIFVDSATRPGHFDQVVIDNFDPYIDYVELLTPEKFSSLVPVEFEAFEAPHRMYLAQISPDEVRMKLEISHALVDGQSTEVLLRDLCTSYLGAQLSGQALGYGEFVSYQNQVPIEPSRAYWSGFLSHARPSFLPMDRGHEALSGLDMVCTDIVFDSGYLQDFCGQYGVTLSNVCQLAWGLVLRCFTGSDSISFSYITSGRSAPLEGIHDAVGPFVTTLPCCLNLSGTSRSEDLLKAVSKDSLEGFSHRYSADLYDKSTTSARQLGNTTMSFQRVLDTKTFSESALMFSVVERSNPTDVSGHLPSRILLILLTSMTLRSESDPSETDSTLN